MAGYVDVRMTKAQYEEFLLTKKTAVLEAFAEDVLRAKTVGALVKAVTVHTAALKDLAKADAKATVAEYVFERVKV